ncbi:hypothetical protein [Streptosporangium vulgare]|uniref:Uncharacterized protein n=1 Tax=Streptosporangium vulgare TaxID=46190 RepID=A0ABV5T8D2_9ACTN
MASTVGHPGARRERELGRRAPAVRPARPLAPGPPSAPHDEDGSGVSAVRGRAAGVGATACRADATVARGATGAADSLRIVDATSGAG